MATMFGLLLMEKMEDKVRKALIRRANICPDYLQFPKRFPPQPEVEKTVYIRGSKDGHSLGTMDWYAFKLSSNAHCSSPPGVGRKRKRGGKEEAKIKCIKAISEKAETPWSSCCVSLGSTIYCIGGGEFYKDSSRNVIASDAVGGGQWSEVYKMKASRARAHAVTAGDRIYVFGGLGKGNDNEVLKPCGPQIEVIDPINKTRESVQPPPVPFNYSEDGFFVTYDDVWKKIISGSFKHRVLLSYDVTKGDSWQVLDNDFKKLQMSILSGPALLHSCLYWISSDDKGVLELFLYDMKVKMWAWSPIFGFDQPVHHTSNYYIPPFFHFCGNQFCLIWLDGMDVGCGYIHSVIQCSRILVSKRVDKQKLRIRLKAYCLSTQTYILPASVHIMDAVVLEGTVSEKEVEKLEDSASAQSWHFH